MGAVKSKHNRYEVHDELKNIIYKKCDNVYKVNDKLRNLQVLAFNKLNITEQNELVNMNDYDWSSKSIKERRYDLTRSDYTLKSNLTSSMDGFLVENSRVYTQLDIFKDIIFNISPRTDVQSQHKTTSYLTTTCNEINNCIDSIKSCLDTIVALKTERCKIFHVNKNNLQRIMYFRNKLLYYSKLIYNTNSLNYEFNLTSVYSYTFLLKNIKDIENSIRNKINTTNYEKNRRIADNISFVNTLFYMNFYIKIIEDSINIRINERNKRHNEKRWGYNSRYATLWEYHKKVVLKNIQDEINICINFCNDIKPYLIDLIEIIDLITLNKSFVSNNVSKLNEYIRDNKIKNKLYSYF